MKDSVARIAARLEQARRLLFITGAGMSADSGLPTYRGVGGLYEDIATDDGMPIEEALSGEMMRRKPELCWRYIAEIEAACRGAKPNAGHAHIARLEQRFDVWVLTQNVDGLHRGAGSSQIIDIHGDVRDLLCMDCEERRTVSSYAGLVIPPRCTTCGAIMRPDVVLFGEALPERKLETLKRELMRGFDAVFSIGTSSLFPYIAQPVLYARRAGGLTVEINPQRTTVSEVVEERIVDGASDALAAIVAGLAG